MIKKILLLLCLVLFGSSRIFAAIDNKDVNITVGSESRVYKLYVPDSFTSTSDPVLIFSLHGANCSRNSGRPDFDAVADQKGCVVVYPQGLTQNYYLLNIQGTGWDATGQSNKDLDYLKAIIEDVAQYYTAKGKTLNRKRIYCCGFSNGGMMTYSNSNTASDIFAAFASISGFPVNEYHLRHSGARPVPFLHIHGGADDFVNVAWYPTVRDIMVARNGCNPVPTETSGSAAINGTSTTYKKYEYAASEGGFPYIYYNVSDMGHSDNCTIGGKSSSMVMYEFMTQYSLDSECDKTLKWKEQVDYSGYYPQNHGWNIESSSSLSYGTSQAANNADHNVYYDIQLEAGSYELRVKTSGTTGDKMTFKLETVGGTSVVNQEVTVGADASIAFITSAYAQYKLTFTKGNTDDKITSVAIHQTAELFTTATLAEAQTSGLPVVLVKDDLVMNATWGTYNDNGKMQSKAKFTEKSYQIKISPVTISGASNTYTIMLKEDGVYSRFLQASKWGHAFFNSNYDNDGANCAVWIIKQMSDGKYSIRSLGIEQGVIRSDNKDGYLCVNNDSILRIDSTTPVGWEFCIYDDPDAGSVFEPIEAPRVDYAFRGYDANSGYTLRPIRQYGKDFVYADDVTQKVTLHGVMDTPNNYFNNARWAPNYDVTYNSDYDVERCLGYFETLLSAFVNHEAGSYVDLFRLHLDPAWTNDPNKKAKNGGGENDISRFSADRLRTYMDKLYWPIAKKAIDKGMYVIMRPPGVCPKTVQVGGEYQNYLETVWDIVSSNENVKKYAGMIMIELANEPITVLDKDGKNSTLEGKENVLHDFFQPIVDVIRKNGFKGIILSSGSGYQWHYEGYQKYPITGDNIGYAVHWYPGWHGTKSTKDEISDQEVINTFKSDVPVVESRPVVITEVDWSPENESGKIDHYNEMNQPVYENYGTWATGYTSRFGKNFKATYDYFGNISMTLTHPYEYVDFDQLFGNGKVTYSFQSKPTPKEACAYTCFVEWYPYYYRDHTRTDSGDDTPSEDEELINAIDLTASLFHEWTGVDADATIKTENGGGACVLNEPTGLPYGHGSVVNTLYADLSAYSKLVVTVTSGEPRFCFNRQPNDNDVLELEFPRDKESKLYETVITNADGSKSYTIDLDAIVKEYGYAHLNAIKGAYWTDVTVTSMKLYPSLDINRDGRVTILDVAYLIEMLNGKVTLNGRQNVNGDTLFDAADVSALGGHLLER